MLSINHAIGYDIRSLRQSFSFARFTSNPSSGATPTRKLRVLLLDDEKDVTTIFKKGLTLKGFKVDAFNDPILALEKFETDKYDVIVSDIKMPKMNGFEFYRRIAKMDDKVRIFFFTAFEIYEHEARLAFPNLPSECFIAKPVSIEQLAKTIS